MTRSELIAQLAAKMNITESAAETAIHKIFERMSDALIAGDGIEIRGFGSFQIRHYDGYTGRNPKTGDEAIVKPKKSPFFKVGKDLKERIMNGVNQ